MTASQTLTKEELLATAKARADNWRIVYAPPIRNIPLEVRLIDTSNGVEIIVEAKVHLTDNQQYLLDEYKKRLIDWYHHSEKQSKLP